jgi:hypothetical protein
MQMYSTDRILEKVISYRAISLQGVKSTSQTHQAAYSRQLCMFFLKKYTTLTLKQIADVFGRKDHTTALHGIQHVNDLCDTDKLYHQERDIIDDLITKNINWMQTEDRKKLEKFISAVREFREISDKAKAQTRSGNHGKARELHADATKLADTIDKMIPYCNSIVKGAEELPLL